MNKIERKTFPLEIKEFSEDGVLTGLLSTFGNIDKTREVVEKGAFKKTLKEKKVFPLIWHHNMSLPDLIVGTFTAKENEVGLETIAEFFDDEESQKVRKKTKRLLDRGVNVGLSMGYRVIKDKYDTVDGQPVRRLLEVALEEGSITLFPANDLALVESVKSLEDILGKLDQRNIEDASFEYEMKPYPNEHACRLNDPDKYTRFRRITRKHDGKTYAVIIGFKPEGGSEEQAYRYPKDEWSEEEARTHCKEHEGRFEPASKSISIRCSSCNKTLEIELPDTSTAQNEPSQSKESGERLLKEIQGELEKFRR
jgi:hypothetical protein